MEQGPATIEFLATYGTLTASLLIEATLRKAAAGTITTADHAELDRMTCALQKMLKELSKN